MDAAASASHPALAALMERVRAAHADATPLALRGSGSKAFYGEPPRGEPLDLRPLEGISSYQPTELVVTARIGDVIPPAGDKRPTGAMVLATGENRETALKAANDALGLIRIETA